MSEIFPEDTRPTADQLQHKLDNVAKLMDAWMGYCHMSGQTGRIIEEVREVLAGIPVMAGTQWIQ